MTLSHGSTAPTSPGGEDRATKKLKHRDSSAGRLHDGLSVKDSLVNSDKTMADTRNEFSSFDFDESEVTVVYDGPVSKILFSDQLENNLAHCWRRAVIIKLLGRTMGFKAVSMRLQAM